MRRKRSDYPPNVQRFVSKWQPGESDASDRAFWKDFRKAANDYVRFNADDPRRKTQEVEYE